MFLRNSDDPDNWLIKCDYCDNSEFLAESAIADNPKVVSSKFEVFFKSSLFELLNSNSKKVQLNMSKNMIKLSSHVKSFNSNVFAQKWISYLKDKDEEVRKNFGNSIGFILNNKINLSNPQKASRNDTPEELLEFVKMIMDNLVSALNEALESNNQSLHQTLILAAKNTAW